MNKFFKSLALIAAVAFSFASCEDVPSPYELPDNNGGIPEAEVVLPKGDGTAANPFNVKGLTAWLEANEATAKGKEVYVEGVVSSIKSLDVSKYTRAQYYINDTESTTGQFYVYNGLYLNGANFTANDQLKVGDKVFLKGTIDQYNGSFQIGQNSTILKLNEQGEGGGGDATTVDPTGNGTVESPYNVAGVLKFVEENAETAKGTKVVVAATVASIKSLDVSKYTRAQYYIYDGEGTSQFYVYNGLYLGGENFTANDQLKAGDQVVIEGNIDQYNGSWQIGQNSKILKLNGKEADNKGGDNGDGNQGDVTEITCEKAAELCSALADKTESTEVYTVTGYITETDGKISRDQQIFWMADTKDGGKVFEAYWANIPDPTNALPVGTKVKMTGKLKRYGSTAEMQNGNVEVLEMGDGGGNTTPDDGGNTGGDNTGASTLENGDFESWVSSTEPTGWKSASTASNAKLSQSTTAHGGKYAVEVEGNETSNKRLASQEITLEAGTYTFSFYAKAKEAGNSQVRPGYVPVTDGKVGSYMYGDYATLSNGEWTLATYEFTLSAKSTICLVIMNPKKSNYSDGKPALIDDATLIKK